MAETSRAVESASPADTDRRPADPAHPAPAGPRRRSMVLLFVLLAMTALPLAVAVGVLGEPRWYPMGDDAQTELRVRDVGTRNPPLTGLGGRIGKFGKNTGSHPGPISFFSMAVFYRLAGAGSFGLHAAVAALNTIALGLVLWLSRRRGGPPAMVGMAAILLVLTTAYGMQALTLPWNPFLPILWWVVALVAVWSLLCADLAMLPVAVFAITFCTQTHISYLGMGGAMAVVGAVAWAYWTYTWRDDPVRVRSSIRWLVIGAGLGAVLWFPPVAEQLTGSQGHNLKLIYRYFQNPPEAAIGLRSGADIVLASLNIRTLVTQPVIDGRLFLGGPIGAGIGLLLVWAGAVAVTWHLRHLTLLRLHALLATALVTGVVSASRIFGPPFVYLALWCWGIAALLLFATVWSFAALAGRGLRASRWDRARSRGAPALAVATLVVLVALSARGTNDAAHTEVFQPELSVRAAALMPQAIDALSRGLVPGTGREGRYLITWTDPWYGGAGGFTVLNELDRAGFHVGGPRFLRYAFTRHRVFEPGQATAEVHLAVGADIAMWSARPDAHRIAFFDPAGPDGRAEYKRLNALLVEELTAKGVADPADIVENQIFSLDFELRLSPEGREWARRLAELGQPSAVFTRPLEPPA